jgi:hypothetical protein
MVTPVFPFFFAEGTVGASPAEDGGNERGTSSSMFVGNRKMPHGVVRILAALSAVAACVVLLCLPRNTLHVGLMEVDSPSDIKAWTQSRVVSNDKRLTYDDYMRELGQIRQMGVATWNEDALGEWPAVPSPPQYRVFVADTVAHEQSAGRAIVWGQLDCYNRQPRWESAALGAGPSRPGGFDVWNRPQQRPSWVPECGTTSEVCVEHMKTCLTAKHPYAASPPYKRPVPAQCDCQQDAEDLGCSSKCIDSIFQSYGQVSARCWGFDAYEGCRYIDDYRLPEERKHVSFSSARGALLSRQQQLEDAAPADAAAAAEETPAEAEIQEVCVCLCVCV